MMFFPRIDKHWRLIGWGQIRRGIAVKPTEKWWIVTSFNSRTADMMEPQTDRHP
jgi:hypothetical protein